MCDWNTIEQVTLRSGKVVDVDSCIAPLVRVLNDSGFETVASCCGHGKRAGNIALADGRELVLARDYEEGRHFDGLFDIAASRDEFTFAAIRKCADDVTEREISKRLSAGSDQKTIARDMGVAPSTVSRFLKLRGWKAVRSLEKK